jgi:hypothetical protein
MTHFSRATLRRMAATTLAVMIAVSAWLLFGPPHARLTDCATAHAMWTYYESQLASERAAAQNTGAENSQTAAAYQNMVDELQTYAGRIATPDIRTKADAIVAINRDMFDQWKRWVAQSQSESAARPTRSDGQFGSAFAQNAGRLKTAHDDLDSACRS